MQLEQNANWQTKARGDNDSEYQIYLACADDGTYSNISRREHPKITTYGTCC